MKHFGSIAGILALLSFTLQADQSTRLEQLKAKRALLLIKQKQLKNYIACTQKELALEKEIAQQYTPNNEDEAFNISFQELYIFTWQRQLNIFKNKLYDVRHKEKELLHKIKKLERSSQHMKAEDKEQPTIENKKQQRNFLYRTFAHFHSLDIIHHETKEKRKSLF